jgi:hypothetical protein
MQRRYGFPYGGMAITLLSTGKPAVEICGKCFQKGGAKRITHIPTEKLFPKQGGDTGKPGSEQYLLNGL